MRKFVSVVTLVLLGSVVFAQQGSGQDQGARERPEPFTVAEISVGKIYTTVGGRLEPESRIIHKTTQTGLVNEIYVSLGESVSVGQPLFSVRQNLPGNRYLPVVVDARINGTVSELLIEKYQEVNSGVPAVVVVNREKLKLEAVASDLDAFSIRNGISVFGSSPDGRKFPGTLNNISIEPDYLTGLFTLTFRFSGSSGARVGIPLLIDLPVKEIRGVFVDPGSIVRRYGRNTIWTIDTDDVIHSRTVETGQVVENRVLITTGLSQGERYLRKPTGTEKDGLSLKELFPSD